MFQRERRNLFWHSSNISGSFDSGLRSLRPRRASPIRCGSHAETMLLNWGARPPRAQPTTPRRWLFSQCTLWNLFVRSPRERSARGAPNTSQGGCAPPMPPHCTVPLNHRHAEPPADNNQRCLSYAPQRRADSGNLQHARPETRVAFARGVVRRIQIKNRRADGPLRRALIVRGQKSVRPIRRAALRVIDFRQHDERGQIFIHCAWAVSDPSADGRVAAELVAGVEMVKRGRMIDTFGLRRDLRRDRCKGRPRTRRGE